MKYYKLLDENNRGCYSGFKWNTSGEWMSVDRPLEMCENGFHVLKLSDIRQWLECGFNLYEVEIGGRAIESENKTCVQKVRVIKKVNGYNKNTVLENVIGPAVRRAKKYASIAAVDAAARADAASGATDAASGAADAVIAAVAAVAAAAVYAADASADAAYATEASAEADAADAASDAATAVIDAAAAAAVAEAASDARYAGSTANTAVVKAEYAATEVTGYSDDVAVRAAARAAGRKAERRLQTRDLKRVVAGR